MDEASSLLVMASAGGGSGFLRMELPRILLSGLEEPLLLGAGERAGAGDISFLEFLVLLLLFAGVEVVVVVVVVVVSVGVGVGVGDSDSDGGGGGSDVGGGVIFLGLDQTNSGSSSSSSIDSSKSYTESFLDLDTRDALSGVFLFFVADGSTRI